MKRFFLGVTLSVVISSVAFAQIPVTDAGSITQLELQLAEIIKQLDQAKRQYESLTGSRDLGKILNDPAVREYLPAEWQSIYDAVKKGGYAGLSDPSLGVYEANKIFDSCERISVGEQRTACEAQAVKAAQDKAVALASYEKAKKRINQIEQLMDKINETKDLKAIADLQGRIALEQAAIQNEQIKLQLYAMAAAAEDRIQAQRQREIQAKIWAAKKGIEVQPITFDKK
jgi:type IV secretion system protein VirB5